MGTEQLEVERSKKLILVADRPGPLLAEHHHRHIMTAWDLAEVRRILASRHIPNQDSIGAILIVESRLDKVESQLTELLEQRQQGSKIRYAQNKPEASEVLKQLVVINDRIVTTPVTPHTNGTSSAVRPPIAPAAGLPAPLVTIPPAAAAASPVKPPLRHPAVLPSESHPLPQPPSTPLPPKGEVSEGTFRARTAWDHLSNSIAHLEKAVVQAEKDCLNRPELAGPLADIKDCLSMMNDAASQGKEALSQAV